MTNSTQTYMSVAKFAKRYGYHPEHVRRMIRKGIIQAERITENGNYRIPVPQLLIKPTKALIQSDLQNP